MLTRLTLGLKSCLCLKLFHRKICQLNRGKMLTTTELYKNWPKWKRNVANFSKPYWCQLISRAVSNWSLRTFLSHIIIIFVAISCNSAKNKKKSKDDIHFWAFEMTISSNTNRGGSRIFFRRGCTRLLLFNTNKPHSIFFAEYQLY